jgi:hypothetical protein
VTHWTVFVFPSFQVKNDSTISANPYIFCHVNHNVVAYLSTNAPEIKEGPVVFSTRRVLFLGMLTKAKR